jgi:hypothetical protein
MTKNKGWGHPIYHPPARSRTKTRKPLPRGRTSGHNHTRFRDNRYCPGCGSNLSYANFTSNPVRSYAEINDDAPIRIRRWHQKCWQAIPTDRNLVAV